MGRSSVILAGLFAALLTALSPAVGSLAQTGQEEDESARGIDLELVLAVDASSSVSPDEFNLQMRGLAQAFRHPAVLAAIQAAGDLGIVVNLVQWSDNLKQRVAVDWTRVIDETSAITFAEEIEATPRFLVGGGTAIGGALSFAMRQFDRNPYEGRRKVIDLSGDGRTNQGARPSDIRDAAVASGITINGLAILNEDAFVDRYYSFNVIGGTGAFVMTASSYEDFADAILAKLIREIAGVPIADLEPPSGPLLSTRRQAASGPVAID